MRRNNGKKIRKTIGFVALTFCSLAAGLGLFWLIFILGDVLRQGFGALNVALFFQDPFPPGEEGGGLRHAFVGQLLITSTAVLIALPIGILGGTYLAEYGRGKRISHFLSILTDTFVSIPSIIVGTFIYALCVKPLGHFSAWAGSLALAIIMVPIISRTTETMLSLVPWTMREAAFALGAPYYKVIVQVVYRGALRGIFTGTLLSLARVAGETAPLLFTSFNNSFFSLKMGEAMASLTVSIYQYALGPYSDWHDKAWAASLIITATVLLLTIIGKIVLPGGKSKR